MKITLIEPQKKQKGRFNIFLDSQFAFGADEDLVVNDRLIPGKVIQKEDLEKLLFEVEVGKLMDRLYGLLSIRARSEKEIRDYLKNLSFKRKLKDKEEIAQVSVDLIIERLKEKGLINDLEFAKAWVESRRRSKQKSLKVLKMELFQKGIDREIIEEVARVESPDKVEDCLRRQESSEGELARLVLEKKIRIWKNLSPQEFKKKAIEFLLRRGFDYEIIKEIIKENTSE